MDESRISLSCSCALRRVPLLSDAVPPRISAVSSPRLVASETGSIVDVSHSFVLCDLRIRTEWPRHLDAFLWLRIVDVLGSYDRSGLDSFSYPLLQGR